jgi:hypothetical protein
MCLTMIKARDEAAQAGLDGPEALEHEANVILDFVERALRSQDAGS